jgi:hypothetical protein
MKKNKINRDNLIGVISEALLRFPPDIQRFQERDSFLYVVLDHFLGAINQKQWVELYQPGKTAEQIADAILSSKRDTKSVPHAGRGGKRGLSRN